MGCVFLHFGREDNELVDSLVGRPKGDRMIDRSNLLCEMTQGSKRLAFVYEGD